mmetsp:Transcript_24176/g.35812  ORF Transcript_24176/g.35812 Transcript_24176/m.35812 type:complete len:1362 (-) Transcript_24176:2038-6123(-)
MQYPTSLKRDKFHGNANDTSSTATSRLFIPHRGTLRRIHHSSSPPPRPPSSNSKSHRSERTSSPPKACPSSFVTYVMNIHVPSSSSSVSSSLPCNHAEQYELAFDRQQYEFCTSLFSILDTESRGSIGRQPIREFVDIRCPVFQRRDYAIRNQQPGKETTDPTNPHHDDDHSSPTFDEVWTAVVSCSHDTPPDVNEPSLHTTTELGVEGWMVFCRLISLAQYQEAKRRFSSRHKQQTMRHRHGGRGSEVVVVNVPPPDPPAPINVQVLVEHELKAKKSLPLPELDLDHCLVSSHDALNRLGDTAGGELLLKKGIVSVSVFGLPKSSSGMMVTSSRIKATSSSAQNLEFVLTYTQQSKKSSSNTGYDENNIIVRRSFADMEWLHDTFVSHKKPGGGTLCGRILPPFPTTSKRSKSYTTSSSSSDYNDEIVSQSCATESNTEIAVNAAKTGVGMIKSMAKSLWGNYVSSSSYSPPSYHQGDASGVINEKTRVVKSIKKKSSGGGSSSNMKQRDTFLTSPSCKAHTLERYLNYLLEHPALSTSFPLNTILKSSQSGLESAKRILEEQSKSSSHQDHFGKSMSQIDHDQTKMSSLMFWSSPLSSSSPLGVSTSSHHQQPNMTWVRTAAQAAMALKVHGILETTGCQSASAKLQHASLPNFESSSKKKGNSSWADEDDEGGERNKGYDNNDQQVGDTCNNDSFENGVVSVESELDTCDAGYDLLPNPVPAPERTVLCAGSSAVSDDAFDNGSTSGQSLGDREALLLTSNKMAMNISQKFRYGVSPAAADEKASTLLGDMAVDDDIDKLREIIGSVDNILGRCFASSAGIGQAMRQRNALHLGVVQSIDSWEGMRGEIITQRALLNGVTMLASSSEVAEECNQTLSEDLSWQSSLASSAVSAAEDVRAAVRASRIATRAKAAAESAAMTAQNICDTKKFSSVDEARAAQTRASIAQGHALHSAVVEHEAMAAKRRAALALAHDVKCWNVHRKREVFRTCRAVAQTQLEASRQAVDAWTQLRHGLLDSSLIPVTDEKRETIITRDEYLEQAEESSAVIYGSNPSATDGQSQPLIIPVDHFELGQTPESPERVRFTLPHESTDEFEVPEEIIGSSSFSEQYSSMFSKEDEAISHEALQESIVISEDHVPDFGVMSMEGSDLHANSINDDTPGETLCVDEKFSEVSAQNEPLTVQDTPGETLCIDEKFSEESAEVTPNNELSNESLIVQDHQCVGANDNERLLVQTLMQPDEESLAHDENNDFDPGLPLEKFDSFDAFRSPQSILQESCSETIENEPMVSQDESDSFHAEGKSDIAAGASMNENNVLTDSMQSLVDGLMTWGGQYDSQDDLTLPTGMAAGIALEESGLLE